MEKKIRWLTHSVHVTTLLAELSVNGISICTRRTLLAPSYMNRVFLSRTNREGRGAILNAQESHARDLHPDVERGRTINKMFALRKLHFRARRRFLYDAHTIVNIQRTRSRAVRVRPKTNSKSLVRNSVVVSAPAVRSGSTAPPRICSGIVVKLTSVSVMF